ncbi:hypothetical protein ACLB2K_043659 [Fragaria x ananassa]
MALNTPTASAWLPTSAESSAAPRWKYDVFLSFRHEDTGRGFTSYLYNELQKREIKTFMDEMILDRGDGISQVILEAIQESRFAIVVLSENYASSSWCLDELTQIIQCMDFKETVVLPVFYHLDPSDVRHQRGAYGHAFVEHEQRFGDQTERLRKWKDALLTVSDFFGWSKNDYESERQFVKQIVEFICSRPIESETRQATDEISPRWKHDVFINFRGMDTRNGFLSHLHDELQNTENLNIVRDDGPDAKGQLIAPYLLKAIEESRFALVVLSPNFAGSSWCLEELAKIFECMGGQKRILPIFYKVDPSDVRRQTGSFGEALARFEDKFEKDKVLKWRRVLTMVANLSGFDSSNYGYEGELIRHVAEECSRRVTELTGDFETTGDVRSMASPQPEPAPVKNDVLSGFGIEDTRRGFVAHSDHELQNTGVSRTLMEHETQNTDENHVEEEIVIPSTSPPSPAVGDPENGVALPSTSPVIGQQNDEFLNTREEDNHRGFVTHLGHETQNTDANHVEDEIAVPSTSPPSLAVGDPENGVALPSTSPVIGQQNDEFLNTRGEDNHRGFVTHLGHETQNTDENHLEEEIAVPSTEFGGLDEWNEEAQAVNLEAEEGASHSLEDTYHSLESDDAKSCFLLCCLFPENYDIPIEELLKYGIGIGLFQYDSMQDARDRAHYVVKYLKDSRLLLEGTKEGCVRMTDDIRNLAMSIALSEEGDGLLVKAGCELEEWPDAEAGWWQDHLSSLEERWKEMHNQL